MNFRDPKLTVLMFNEFINGRSADGLSGLMTDNHLFVDREGNSHNTKSDMLKCWAEFFRLFPDYRNSFNRIESHDNFVVVRGYAFWSAENPYDPAIWTAKVENDLVAEWCIFEDSEENRKKFAIL